MIDVGRFRPRADEPVDVVPLEARDVRAERAETQAVAGPAQGNAMFAQR